jgi:hypothetical protein
MKKNRTNMTSKNRENSSALVDFLPQILLLIFQVFLVFIANSRLSGEDDLFWYLSAGRYIVQSGSVPSFDVFGFTTSGSPWIPFEWGWDIISFFLYNAGGYFALSVLSTVIILVIFNTLYFTMKKLEVNTPLSVLMLIILTLGITQRLTVKPHLITYLSLILLLSFFLRYRYRNRDDHKFLYFTPLIFLIWVNMHMGVISGLFMFGLYFLGELLGTIFPKSFSPENIRPLNSRELKRLALLFFTSALIILINPHGIETFKYAAHIVSMKQLDKIYEWQSPFSGIFLTSASNVFYYIFIFFSVPVVYYSLKRKDILPLLFCAGYFLYSLSAVRLTIDFMIISVTFIAVFYGNLIERIPNTIRNKYKVVPGLTVMLLMLVLIFLIPSNQVYKALGYSRSFGTGIDNSSFPVKMYGFIKSSGLDSIGSRPFNTYETGGYFIWNFPNRKNFIGSRGINDEVWNDYESIINIQTGFIEKLERIGFDYFTWMVPLLNYAQDPGLLDQGILSYLFSSVEWKLVYWDDTSFLFVKNDAKFRKYLEKYEYKFLSPYRFYADYRGLEKALAENKEAFRMELERKRNEDPSGAFTNLMVRYFAGKLK